MICFIQFPERGNYMSGFGGVFDEGNFQFYPEDSSPLIEPLTGIQHSLGAFLARISPLAGERDEGSYFKRGLTEAGKR